MLLSPNQTHFRVRHCGVPFHLTWGNRCFLWSYILLPEISAKCNFLLGFHDYSSESSVMCSTADSFASRVTNVFAGCWPVCWHFFLTSKGHPCSPLVPFPAQFTCNLEKPTLFWKCFTISELYSNECSCFLHRILHQILTGVLTWPWLLTYSRLNIRRKGIWSYLLMFLAPNIVSFPGQMVNVYLLNKVKVEWMLSSHRNAHTYMCTQLWEMYWSLSVHHRTQSWKTHCLLYCDPLYLFRYLCHV